MKTTFEISVDPFARDDRNIEVLLVQECYNNKNSFGLPTMSLDELVQLRDTINQYLNQ